MSQATTAIKTDRCAYFTNNSHVSDILTTVFLRPHVCVYLCISTTNVIMSLLILILMRTTINIISNNNVSGLSDRHLSDRHIYLLWYTGNEAYSYLPSKLVKRIGQAPFDLDSGVGTGGQLVHVPHWEMRGTSRVSAHSPQNSGRTWQKKQFCHVYLNKLEWQ